MGVFHLKCATTSVTRLLVHFSIFGHLHQNYAKFAKVGWKFCQIVNNPKNLPKTLKILPNVRNFAKSGHTESTST